MAVDQGTINEWGDLIVHICELADAPLASETPGVHRDDEMDALIMAARRVRDREGFVVTDGSELED